MSITGIDEYRQFIASKSQSVSMHGFEPKWMPKQAMDFQQCAIDWATRKGRGGLFADCGLGKSLMSLAWGENVVRRTNKPVLYLTPIAVGAQAIKEANKFGIEAVRSRDGQMTGKKCVVIVNYEQLKHYNPDDFGGVACDESQIFKNFDGKTKELATEFMRTIPYRLLCTATAAPNDYDELGTSSEALGEMGYQDMLTRFFVKENQKDHLGWGRANFRLRINAERDFWRWVCSWSRAFRKPSDLGDFDDTPFQLPPLEVVEHEVKPTKTASGRLFDIEARGLREQREEQRRTLRDRCEKVAELAASHNKSMVAWCHLNDEADLLEELIPDGKQVSGSHSDDEKELLFNAFVEGQLRVLIIKPKIGALGLNWQHCAHQTYFPSHSYESYFQGVRRSWRFGQKNTVRIDIVNTEGGAQVMASLRRKAEAADRMFAELVANMNQSMRIDVQPYGTKQEGLPKWLSSIS